MLTNNLGLPEPLFEAVRNDSYDAGKSDLTVTQIIAPIQAVELVRRHRDEIDTDASERLWAMYGQLIHSLLERSVKDNPRMAARYLTENRIFQDVLGWKISGQFDLYDKETNTLYDYKFVGGYAVKLALQEGKIEWEQQLNLLRLLFWKKHGILAEKVAIVGIVRDWSERSQKEGIPPAATIPFPLWDVVLAQNFLFERVRLHQVARGLADNLLRPCTDEERWFRNGKNGRCQKYCDARSVCLQKKSFDLIKVEA